jgi:DNA mismatch endonuclease (patch repair protein)
MEEILKGINAPYEIQPSLAGHPDFRILRTKILIFCDSSFWHGRRKQDLMGKSFKKNRAYWTNKMIRNRERDARTNRKLRLAGWKTLRFWDDSILRRPDLVAARILEVAR